MAIGVKVLERPIAQTSYVRATLKGMGLTLWHIFREKVTYQYPEEKWSLSPRWRGTHRMLTTEDGSTGERGRIVAPLERRLAARGAGAPIMIYACGPEGMLAATAKTAARFGRPCQVSVERIMGCGLGGCYSCVVPMRDDGGDVHHVRSCLAGPVLAADRILWP